MRPNRPIQELFNEAIHTASVLKHPDTPLNRSYADIRQSTIYRLPPDSPDANVEDWQPFELVDFEKQNQTQGGLEAVPVLTAPNPGPRGHLVTWKQHAGPLVNDIFEETDIRQAIQSLATQAKVSVIVDDTVSGVATAMIEDEPFEAALEKILLPLGYVWGKKGDQYLVGTMEPDSALFRFLSERVVYRPQHHSPEDLMPLLPENQQKYIRTVGKRNVMVIEAPNMIASQIMTELEQADQPVAQVLLEAIIVVYSPEKTLEYGLDLKQMLAGSGDPNIEIGVSGLALSGALSPSHVHDLVGRFAITSYFLRLLAQEGYVKIRAAPSVMAKDGEEAQISISRESYFSVQPTNNENFFFRQEIEKVESGITLNITPVVRGGNVTVLIERAEVSEDIRESGTNDNIANPFPLINRRTVATTVNVKDGHTIVIGGLTHRQKVDRVSRVPILCKMPLFGHIFQQVDKQEQEAEVAVFISPKIVSGNVGLEPEGAMIPEILPTPAPVNN